MRKERSGWCYVYPKLPENGKQPGLRRGSPYKWPELVQKANKTLDQALTTEDGDTLEAMGDDDVLEILPGGGKRLDH